MQYNQISRLPDPSKYDLHALQEWLQRPSLGGVRLLGRDKDIWAHGVDLASIGGHAKSNPLRDWIAESCLPVFHRVIGRHLAIDTAGLFETSKRRS